MLLTINKTIQETREVQTPSWYKNENKYYYLTEDKVIVIGYQQLTLWNMSSSFAGSYVDDALKGEPITQAEFESKFSELVTELDKIVYSITSPQ